MSQFKALNIESDVESDEEIDDTKEIQIEEALKLYQNALKLHSEGPRSFDAAAQAYKALFESEIFRYPESFSDYHRTELHDDIDYDGLISPEDFEAGPALANAADSAPNTLPQILHLSYKNHGQFTLEVLQHRLREHHERTKNELSQLAPVDVAATAKESLSYFAEALDKDDSDLDLWSRTSSVAALVGSDRIARFCLEAVLHGDGEGLDSILRIPGLQEGFAGVELRELVQTLQDDLSLAQAPLSNLKGKKLSAALRKRLAPYSFTPLSAEVNRHQKLRDSLRQPPLHITLNPIKADWAHVGDSILHEYLQSPQRLVGPVPGVLLTLSLPPIHSNENTLQHVDSTSEAAHTDARPWKQDDVADRSAPNGRDTAFCRQSSAAMAMREAAAELDRQAAAAAAADGGANNPEPTDQPTTSRKRSTDSAGLPESAEGGRGRSKRIRARESIGEGALGPNSAGTDTSKQQGETELSQFEQADEWLFEIVSEMLAKLGVNGLRSPTDLRKTLQPDPYEPTPSSNRCIDIAARDLFAILQSCPPQAVSILFSGDSIDALGGTTREAGLAAFLGYAKSAVFQGANKPMIIDDGLLQWTQTLRQTGLPVKELLWSWLEQMLRPGTLLSTGGQGSSYVCHKWSEDLKRIVVQAIVNADDFIFDRLLHELSALDTKILKATSLGNKYDLTNEENALVEMVQTIFELHLDVYSLIKHPGSSVDGSTQTLQKERLERWAGLARDAIRYRVDNKQRQTIDELEFRHLWASAFHLSVADDVDQEFIIYCIEELKAIADHMPRRAVYVQNNAIMPELSVAAAERELTKINMKDCFMKIFQHDENDPVAVIENLEPILESSNVTHSESKADPKAFGIAEIKDSQDVDSSEGSDMETQDEVPQQMTSGSRTSPLKAMTQFISSANATLRLSLWQRLRQAYEAIDYTPKVVSCYLRSIEILMNDLQTAGAEMSSDQRTLELLKSLRIIDEILVRTIGLCTDNGALETIDEAHMISSLDAIAALIGLLNSLNVYEDAIRVGRLPPPMLEGRINTVFPTVAAKLHDTQIRAWMLQWLLLGDAMSSTGEFFPTPAEEKFEYLRHMHYAFAIRGTCSASNKLFLRAMKDELLKMFKAGEINDIETRDTVLCQVLYDLYGIFCFTNPADKVEYATERDVLDQKTAIRLVDFILYQTRKVNIKDLHKTQLSSTIDVVHGHLARTKPASADDLALNRMKYLAFIKSAIRPVDLYRCLNGIGELSMKPIAAKNARIAAKGWHFLMGSIALNRFRSQIQKRQAPIPTEDINIASAFFVQDLEYDADRWETWYNQAQAHDYQIDELVAWSAEKVNKGDPEIVQYQRSAIQCYRMAVATAVRNADGSDETISKMANLYADFGMRIYASSREPFSMQAFALKESEERYYSMDSVRKGPSVIPLEPYSAWKFASGLFKRAIARKPDHWVYHYMLGKCLWKMHCTDDPHRRFRDPPSAQDVVDAFVRSIDELPEKRDRREPILEPHYKLLSIVHKLVQRKDLEPRAASRVLQASHYAKQVSPFSPEDDPEEHDDWDDYVLKVLKVIRTADKSNWHHRMTARAARIHYGDPSPDYTLMAALTAKNEFTQQIFTKTMQLQVWKPEYERLGRHFVYTTRYTQFFILLLDKTNDRAGMEALARRVRRRNHDFYEHSKLWHTLCVTYLKMLRRTAKIPEGHEDAVFKSIAHDEFVVIAGRLELWCHSGEQTNPTHEVLRETIELRRLNNGLMKATLIDDLIGDTYAKLYAEVGTMLPPLPSEVEPPQQPTPPPQAQPQASRPALVEMSTVRSSNMMSMQNIMNADSGSEAPQPPQPTTPAFHIMTMAPQPQQQLPDPAPKPRAKGVGRRELMRRADAAVTRPVLPSVLPVRSSAGPTSEPQVRIAVPTNGGEGEGEVEGEEAGPSGGVASVEQSAPGSVHDSADDESELSDVDEDVVEGGTGMFVEGEAEAEAGVEVEVEVDGEDKAREVEEDVRMEE